MSHILDALKQAEDERRLGQPPSRVTIAGPLRKARQRAGTRHAAWLVPLLLTATAVIIIAVAFGLWYTPERTASNNTVGDAAPGVTSTSPATEAEPVVVAPQGKPAVTSRPVARPTGTGNGSALSALQRAEIENPERLTNLDALFASDRRPRTSPSATSAAGRPTAGSTGDVIEPQDLFVDDAAAVRGVGEGTGADTRVDSGESTNTRTLSPPESSLSSGARGQRARSSLPSAEAVGAPGFNVDVHVYNPDAAKRFVLVNGRRVESGDRIADDTVLETIERDHLILRWRGERVYRALP